MPGNGFLAALPADEPDGDDLEAVSELEAVDMRDLGVAGSGADSDVSSRTTWGYKLVIGLLRARSRACGAGLGVMSLDGDVS